jgi:hypothetical protein
LRDATDAGVRHAPGVIVVAHRQAMALQAPQRRAFAVGLEGELGL